MASTLEDIYTYLNASAPFTNGSTTYTLRTNFVPDSPDATITLISAPAGKPIRAMGASLSAPIRDRHLLTVVTRSTQKDYDNAQTMADSVHALLDFYNGTLSGKIYQIDAMHSPALRTEDQSNRWWIECNYRVLRQR